MIDTDRLPPHDRSAERALLGTMLRSESSIPEITVLVKAEECYVFAHQLVFEAIIGLTNSGQKADLVTVAERLSAISKLDEVGGVEYLFGLWDASPAAQNYKQYAAIVRDHWMRRQAIQASREVQRSAYDLATPASEVIEEAERKIFAISDAAVTQDTVSLQDAMTQTYERLDARVQRANANERIGVPTGLIDLDGLLAGFQQSELTLLAARPSLGKTSLALQFAKNAALECGIPTLFVSLEQSRTELTERLLCNEARIDSYRMRRGFINSDEQSKILEAGGRLAQTPLYFDDAPSQTIMRVAATARRMKARKDIQIVFIDYLQLIEPENHRMPRNEQVAATSRRLKWLARELKIPVVALAQFNRTADEGKTQQIPKLSQLKDSGALEQDADTVIAIQREQEDQADSAICVYVLKQRNGPTGDCKLMFVRNFMRFENFAFPTGMS